MFPGSVLSSNPGVQAHAIFIASFGDEAAQILRELPGGRYVRRSPCFVACVCDGLPCMVNDQRSHVP